MPQFHEGPQWYGQGHSALTQAWVPGPIAQPSSPSCVASFHSPCDHLAPGVGRFPGAQSGGPFTAIQPHCGSERGMTWPPSKAGWWQSKG